MTNEELRNLAIWITGMEIDGDEPKIFEPEKEEANV